MLDIVEIIKQVGFNLDIGYWLIDLESRTVYWPRGLGRPAGHEGERGYVVSSLDKTLAQIDEADQGHFRAFLADILKGAGDYPIEVTHNATWGAKIRVRLAGRQLGVGKDAKIVGLVEVIDRWREAERLAKSLSFIIEALFISSDDGIVIFDNQLKIRRLNRNALDLFGITEADEERGDWSETIEEKLPRSTRDALLEAIENSVAVSGTLNLGGLGGSRLAWRANPWGSGIGEMSGLVMTVQTKASGQGRSALAAERELLRAEVASLHAEKPAPPPPVLPPAPRLASTDPDGHSHRALEWVKHPIVLVSISTGEVVFANRSARDHFHLPSGRRIFVENVYDLSGFACDVDPLAITSAGGVVSRLRLGARVGRMLDYDEDLLFIEYHDDIPHPIPHPVSRPLTSPTPAPAAPPAARASR